jgi:(heptosyl)LPS beta-1,4-glucosyltransferase
MLDADEEISTNLQNSIKEVIKGDPKIYKVNRLSKAFGYEVKHSGWFPDWISRLYPNNLTTYNDALVHETLIIPKDYEPSKITGILYHETYKTMTDYYQKMSLYIDAWSSQNVNKKNGGLLIGTLRGYWAFIKMYFIKLGFLDGVTGLTLAFLRYQTTVMKYVDLKIKKRLKKTN